MRFTLMVETGWCGFGYDRDLVPEIRLGFVRFACTRGSVAERLRGLLQSLADASAELRAARRPRIVPAPPPKTWDREQ